jgi:hypothetical protein
MEVQKASHHKKVSLIAGLSFNVSINTHNCVNFIICSQDIYSRNMKECNEESIL